MQPPDLFVSRICPRRRLLRELHTTAGGNNQMDLPAGHGTRYGARPERVQFSTAASAPPRCDLHQESVQVWSLQGLFIFPLTCAVIHSPAAKSSAPLSFLSVPQFVRRVRSFGLAPRQARTPPLLWISIPGTIGPPHHPHPSLFALAPAPVRSFRSSHPSVYIPPRAGPGLDAVPLRLLPRACAV
jgi:hypothetical protein